MNIILAKTDTGKSTDLITRFMEAGNNSILISNEYDERYVLDICTSKLKLSNEEIKNKIGDKVLFHLTKSSAEALSKVIIRYLQLGFKEFFIDDFYNIIFKSDEGFNSILLVEEYHGVEFTLTLQQSNAKNNEYEERVNRFKERINLITLS